MGNEPVASVDPDGGFNFGSTALFAVAGFGIGSLAGLALDKENWLMYGTIGAIVGGSIGASAGDITINGNDVTAWEKFAHEVEFAITSKGRPVSKGRFEMEKNYAFGPGPKPKISYLDIPIFSAEPYGRGPAATGFKKVRWGAKNVVQGVVKSTVRVIVEDEYGQKHGDFSPKSQPGPRQAPEGDLKPYQTFEVELPKGTTAVKLKIGWPLADYGDGIPRELGGMDYIMARHKFQAERIHRVSKDALKVRVKSTTQRWTGGNLFRVR